MIDCEKDCPHSQGTHEEFWDMPKGMRDASCKECLMEQLRTAEATMKAENKALFGYIMDAADAANSENPDNFCPPKWRGCGCPPYFLSITCGQCWEENYER